MAERSVKIDVSKLQGTVFVAVKSCKVSDFGGHSLSASRDS